MITIPDCTLAKDAKAILVGEKNEVLKLTIMQDKAQIELPEKLAYTTAFLVKISGLKE